MKVILLKDVKGHGKKDDVVELKDGYANFLIKNKDAVVYSNKSLEVLHSEIKSREEKYDGEVNDAKKVGEKLAKIKLEFVVKTGKEDKVFGSISSKQICESLSKKGFNVDKKNIKIEGELNTLGTHIIKVVLHKEVICDVSVCLKK